MEYKTLTEIVEQLESCQFATDESGRYACEAGPLERNVAFIALKEMAANEQLEKEPYMGWCDVDGCPNESAANGVCWPETGYWLCCSDHAKDYRMGLKQPKMKQDSIDREASRDENGVLP